MSGPGYSARCRACNSKHRVEIDRRLLAGDGARSVSEWLSTQGEKLSHVALQGHRAEHLDVRADAAARVAEAAPVFEAAVEKIIADVHVLDEVATLALQVARALAPQIAAAGGKPSMPVAVAFAGALSNARAAVTDRHEMLYGKKLEVTGGSVDDADALHARVAAALALPAGGADPGPAGGADAGAAG